MMGAVVDEECLGGHHAAVLDHALEDLGLGLHAVHLVGDVEAVEVVRDGPTGSGKLARARPTGDDGIVIAEHIEAVAGPETEDVVELLDLRGVGYAEPCAADVLRVELVAAMGGELVDKLVRVDRSALQVAEESAVVVGVDKVCGVGYTDGLEAADGTFRMDLSQHAAHVEYDVVDHYDVGRDEKDTGWRTG